MTTHAPTTTPTQTRYPWRAAVRTALQVGIPVILALGVVVPEVVRIVLEEVGARTDVPDWLRVTLLGTAAVVTGVSAVLARIMALPQVEAWLEQIRSLSWMAASPPGRHRDDDTQARVDAEVAAYRRSQG